MTESDNNFRITDKERSFWWNRWIRADEIDEKIRERRVTPVAIQPHITERDNAIAELEKERAEIIAPDAYEREQARIALCTCRSTLLGILVVLYEREQAKIALCTATPSPDEQPATDIEKKKILSAIECFLKKNPDLAFTKSNAHMDIQALKLFTEGMTAGKVFKAIRPNEYISDPEGDVRRRKARALKRIFPDLQ